MLRTTVLSGVVPFQLSCCPWGTVAPVKSSSCHATEPSEDDKPTGQKNIFLLFTSEPLDMTFAKDSTFESETRVGR